MGSINNQQHNPLIEGKYAHINKNDVVFTPRWLAKIICEMFPIEGRVLEPAKGEGVFMEFLPKGTEWCEIAEGRNFFDYSNEVDWIVTNPPYSDFNRFLEHSFELSNNVVFLVPVAKMFKSMGTIKTIMSYGGIVSYRFLSGGQAGFPFGFPVGVCYMKRNYRGETKFEPLETYLSQTKGGKKDAEGYASKKDYEESEGIE